MPTKPNPNLMEGDVLLIGRQSAAQKQFREELTKASFGVTCVPDGQKALEQLRQRVFDLVMVDVKLPKTSGLELLRRLRGEMDLPRTILLAEKLSNDISIQANELNAITLEKPVLAAVIVNLLRGQRTSRRRHPGVLMRAWAHSLSATTAKNSFSDALETAIHNGPVVITKHRRPSAVLISYDEYTRAHQSQLGKLADEFDALLKRMQQPSTKAGMEAAFNASPEELGQAALKGAKQRG